MTIQCVQISIKNYLLSHPDIRNVYSNYSVFEILTLFACFERNSSASTLYDTKNNSYTHRQHSSSQSEHLLDLPSDIFVASQTSTHDIS